MAAPACAIDLVESGLPYRFTKVYHDADGNFPHGVPNPMIEENRAVTSEAVRKQRADFGIAFDGDFDRCFFFDEQGRFHRGLLHRRPAGDLLPGEESRLQHRLRPAPDLEHAGHRAGAWRQGGDLQVRPCLHEGRHARGGCHLRRRNECAPLLPPILILRQRHDPVAGDGATAVRGRPAAVHAGGRAHPEVSRRAAKSTARSPTSGPRSRTSSVISCRAPSRSSRSTGFRSRMSAGASTCARPIRSRWSA